MCSLCWRDVERMRLLLLLLWRVARNFEFPFQFYIIHTLWSVFRLTAERRCWKKNSEQWMFCLFDKCRVPFARARLVPPLKCHQCQPSFICRIYFFCDVTQRKGRLRSPSGDTWSRRKGLCGILRFWRVTIPWHVAQSKTKKKQEMKRRAWVTSGWASRRRSTPAWYMRIIHSMNDTLLWSDSR